MKIDWEKYHRDLKEEAASWVRGYEYRMPVRVDSSMLNFSVETFIAIHATKGKDILVPLQLFLGGKSEREIDTLGELGNAELQEITITEGDGQTRFECEIWTESETCRWVKFTVPTKFVGVLFYIFYNKKKLKVIND